jgi:hypothetical protein
MTENVSGNSFAQGKIKSILKKPKRICGKKFTAHKIQRCSFFRIQIHIFAVLRIRIRMFFGLLNRIRWCEVRIPIILSSRKNSDFFMTLYLYLNNDVTVASKSNKKKNYYYEISRIRRQIR